VRRCVWSLLRCQPPAKSNFENSGCRIVSMSGCLLSAGCAPAALSCPSRAQPARPHVHWFEPHPSLSKESSCASPRKDAQIKILATYHRRNTFAIAVVLSRINAFRKFYWPARCSQPLSSQSPLRALCVPTPASSAAPPPRQRKYSFGGRGRGCEMGRGAGNSSWRIGRGWAVL
jgi:hypothetical protein